MLRFILIFALCAPLLAAEWPRFSLERKPRRSAELFALDDEAAPAQPAPAPRTPATEKATPDKEEARPIYDWYGRGFGISLVFTGAIAFPAGGIALEACLPLHQRVGLFVRGGVIGGVFFEGTCFDFGVRAYYDTSRTFTLYHDLGFRVMYGRILDFFGNDPDELKDVIHRFGVGGFTNLGLEVGATWIRFFGEVTINGAKTLGEEFEVLFFIGLNFGIRFYIGG